MQAATEPPGRPRGSRRVLADRRLPGQLFHLFSVRHAPACGSICCHSLRGHNENMECSRTSTAWRGISSAEGRPSRASAGLRHYMMIEEIA